jgi:hypothetical protein
VSPTNLHPNTMTRPQTKGEQPVPSWGNAAPRLGSTVGPAVIIGSTTEPKRCAPDAT